MKGNNVFADSLMGTTIQDGGKRERRSIVLLFLYPSCLLMTNNSIFSIGAHDFVGV